MYLIWLCPSQVLRLELTSASQKAASKHHPCNSYAPLLYPNSTNEETEAQMAWPRVIWLKKKPEEQGTLQSPIYSLSERWHYAWICRLKDIDRIIRSC